MLTNEEFKLRWKQLTSKQKKFVLAYLEFGLDAHIAAIKARICG